MARYWVRPRKYGYGATPKTWQGGALIAAYRVALGLLAVWLRQETPPSLNRVMIYAASAVGLTIALVWICRIKTDGVWRWRWGGEP